MGIPQYHTTCLKPEKIGSGKHIKAQQEQETFWSGALGVLPSWDSPTSALHSGGLIPWSQLSPPSPLTWTPAVFYIFSFPLPLFSFLSSSPFLSSGNWNRDLVTIGKHSTTELHLQPDSFSPDGKHPWHSSKWKRKSQVCKSVFNSWLHLWWKKVTTFISKMYAFLSLCILSYWHSPWRACMTFYLNVTAGMNRNHYRICFISMCVCVCVRACVCMYVCVWCFWSCLKINWRHYSTLLIVFNRHSLRKRKALYIDTIEYSHYRNEIFIHYFLLNFKRLKIEIELHHCFHPFPPFSPSPLPFLKILPCPTNSQADSLFLWLYLLHTYLCMCTHKCTHTHIHTQNLLSLFLHQALEDLACDEGPVSASCIAFLAVTSQTEGWGTPIPPLGPSSPPRGPMPWFLQMGIKFEHVSFGGAHWRLAFIVTEVLCGPLGRKVISGIAQRWPLNFAIPACWVRCVHWCKLGMKCSIGTVTHGMFSKPMVVRASCLFIFL